MKKIVEYEELVCDYCGELAHQQCLFCGKDTCSKHTAWVYSGVSRRKRHICLEHLPEEIQQLCLGEGD